MLLEVNGVIFYSFIRQRKGEKKKKLMASIDTSDALSLQTIKMLKNLTLLLYIIVVAQQANERENAFIFGR